MLLKLRDSNGNIDVFNWENENVVTEHFHKVFSRNTVVDWSHIKFSSGKAIIRAIPNRL